MWYSSVMNIFMKMTWPKFILSVIAGYVIIFMFSPSMANFVLALIIVCLVPFLILRFFLLDNLYKASINIVDKKFVLNNNALHNDHCTVIYTPDEKIVVMDNIADRRCKKRMFTLTKKQLRVNKAWNRLCRIYDCFSNVDSLEAFFNYDTKVEVITIDSGENKRQETKDIRIEKSNEGPKFVEMAAIQADPFAKDSAKKNAEGKDFVNISEMKEQEKYIPKTDDMSQNFRSLDSFDQQEKYEEKPVEEQEVVNLDSMQKKEHFIEQDNKQSQELVGIGDLVNQHNTKINVNAVEASELSLLPGINIVMAKKIIEYRNINGNFKTIENFLEVANVKEHFIQKIKEMIYIGQSKDYDSSAEEYEQGRIVDL